MGTAGLATLYLYNSSLCLERRVVCCGWRVSHCIEAANAMREFHYNACSHVLCLLLYNVLIADSVICKCRSCLYRYVGTCGFYPVFLCFMTKKARQADQGTFCPFFSKNTPSHGCKCTHFQLKTPPTPMPNLPHRLDAAPLLRIQMLGSTSFFKR